MIVGVAGALTLSEGAAQKCRWSRVCIGLLLQCTEIELMRIQWRHHHEGARLSFDQISQEGLQLLRERIRLNGHQDSM
jgi:hypothetical protein